MDDFNFVAESRQRFFHFITVKDEDLPYFFSYISI